MKKEIKKISISLKIVFLSILISAFGVLSLWGFWSDWTNILGINFSIWWTSVLLFFLFTNKEKISIKSLSWIIPLFLIILSFALWTNPFARLINFLLLPFVFLMFTIHEAHKNLRIYLWGKLSPLILINSGFSIIFSIFRAPGRITLGGPEKVEKIKVERKTIREIVIGIIILLVLSFFVIIPLLSAADASFAKIFEELIKNISTFFYDIFSATGLAKLAVGLAGTLILLGLSFFWKKEQAISYLFEDFKERNNLPNITTGIILSGTLALYVLFIIVKINTLFIAELPINFGQTEVLVKTGFWQLFCLTIINTLLYIIIYGRTNRPVQKILSLFTLSSLLLIFSAAQGVFKYITNYGLSYEKFFALYTVAFCGLVFLWLIFLSLRYKEINIFKVLMFSSLWAYSLAVIMPIESIIFKTNLSLTQNENSRVDINELTMLSFDALLLVEKNFDLLINEARKDQFQKYSKIERGSVENRNHDPKEDWVSWIEKKRPRSTKLFYEKTLKELGYKPLLEKKLLPPKTKKWVDEYSGFLIEYSAELKPYYYENQSDESSVSFIKNDSSLIRITVYEKIRAEVKGDFYEEAVKKNELLARFKAEKNSKTFNFPDEKTIAFSVLTTNEEREGKTAYGLLFETPTKIFKIATEEYIETIKDSYLLELADYLKLISPDQDAIDVINSLKLIEIKN